MLPPNGCILYPDQYNYLWKTSWLSLISALYAFYHGHYDMVLVPGGVFLTSINYWRKPDYSWRRYADMCYVTGALSYQMLRSCKSQYGGVYVILTTVSAIYFYPLGIYYFTRGKYWHSAYAHSMIHILGNVANIILYSGYIEPL